MSSVSNSSAGKVLVTRPSHQSKQFEHLLKDAGFQVVCLPTIAIDFISADITRALKSELVIFTSVNSVSAAHRCQSLPWQTNGSVAAIGKATAKALQSHKVKVDLQPASASNSEALLEVIQTTYSDLKNVSITIVRGDSGREILFNTLQQLGADVHYLSVYQRRLPVYSKAELQQCFTDQEADIISVTSDLGLLNLLNIVPIEFRQNLLSKPLVVNSQRCAALALSHGFSSSIAVACPPGDQNQVTEISRLARS